VALCLAAIPPLAVAHRVWLTAVDLPTWDAWQFAPAVADLFEGRSDPRDLWAQHNEHRLVVPRALMLGLARVSAWDVRWEQAANVVVALGQLALLAALLRRTVAPAAPRAVPWLVAGASALIFALGAWQNWSWGWQLQIFVNAAAACGTALALAAWRGRWWQTAVLQALSTTAALSFANGLALPLLVPLALLVAPAAVPRRTRIAHAIVAAGAGVAVAAAYLAGFERPPPLPQATSTHVTPLNVARHALGFLGSPFAADDVVAAGVIGAGGLVAVATATLWLWRDGRELRAALLPWALLETYAVASALVTAIGRVGFGVAQALQSRYVTISSLFWLGAAPTLTLAAARWLRTASPTPAQTLRAGLAAGVALGVLAAGWWTAWEAGAAAMHQHAQRMRRARPCVRHFTEAPDDCFVHVHWDPAHCGRSPAVWLHSAWDRLRAGERRRRSRPTSSCRRPTGRRSAASSRSLATAPTSSCAAGRSIRPRAATRIACWWRRAIACSAAPGRDCPAPTSTPALPGRAGASSSRCS
jgi:hypothetical protein